MILTFALFYAIVAVTWICMLCTPGDLLDFLPPIFQRFSPEWLMHLLFGCEKCFAGQLSMWTYPVVVAIIFGDRYVLLDHFLIILTSIFLAGFIGKLYNRI